MLYSAAKAWRPIVRYLIDPGIDYSFNAAMHFVLFHNIEQYILFGNSILYYLKLLFILDSTSVEVLGSLNKLRMFPHLAFH